ncbi:hypothetical protein SVIO_090130 [Streptomyces violaceusniger]|uniref:Uncharacterized protein n=1 Tax=Streptomyces violaceusniger TaxID=68280 RepID=A0A4D4LGX7_STRVO|nr:hypothetical protein SVIO_090130 [Streptomyces violaceusniger]
MEVPGRGQQVRRYVAARGGGECARRGEDGPVVIAGHDDRERCRQAAVQAQSLDVDTVGREPVAQIVSGAVVPDASGEGHAQPQPGGAAGGDRGGSAEGERAAVDELFALAEGEGGVERSDDDVRVGVPDDEQVEGGWHTGS